MNDLRFLGASAAACLALALGAQAVETGPDSAQALRLIPFPKAVTLQTGRFSLSKPLTFEISGNEGTALAQLLNAELQRAGLGAEDREVNR